MTDTTKKVMIKYRQMIMSQSPAHRLAMACRMFTTAKALVRIGIQKMEDIDQDSSKFRERIFLRFYGHDFDEEEKKKILEHLRAI